MTKTRPAATKPVLDPETGSEPEDACRDPDNSDPAKQKKNPEKDTKIPSLSIQSQKPAVRTVPQRFSKPDRPF
jgi:hypothetical protein